MKFAGLQIKVEKNAIYTFCVMVIVLVVVTGVIGLMTGDLRESSFVEVFVVALAAASFHFFAQFIHMIGHALAPWAVGYPKSSMLFIYVFAMSLYPPDEPALAYRIHIQSSLGGGGVRASAVYCASELVNYAYCTVMTTLPRF